MPVPVVHLQLLGQFGLNVRRENHTHHLTYDKPRLILAMLALSTGNSIARSRLIELLWPDLSEVQGKTRMRHALHVLRHALGECADVLIVQNDRLSLDHHQMQVDVCALLAEGELSIDDEMCLALYKGPLLDDLSVRIDGPLLEWFEYWHQQLNQRLAQCRTRLVSTWLNKNQLNDALRYARHWIQVWPDDESCYRHLIDVLVRAGHYDEAYKVYNQGKTRLTSSFDIEASVELERLFSSLPLLSINPAGAVLETERSFYRPLAVLAIALSWKNGSSTPCISDDDLEKIEHVAASIHRCAQEYSGWLEHGVGNQFLVYFGYPAITALPVNRAASMAAALRRRDFPAELSIKMALHADIGLCKASRGKPDNGYLLAQSALALVTQAQANEVLVSMQAQSRIDTYDVYDIEREGRSHRVLGEARASGVSRIVGRNLAFTTLINAWRACITERKIQRFVLCGAAGYGKSLLASSVAMQAQQVGARVVLLKCMQDMRDQPMHPLRLWLLDRLPWDIERVNDDRIASAFQVSVIQARALKSFLRLGVKVTSADITPILISALNKAIFGELSENESIFIVLDDVHWADSFSQEWCEEVEHIGSQLPLMILRTQNLVNVANPGHEFIHLPALDDQAVDNLLSRHSRALKLSKKTQELIATLASGNPQLVMMMVAQAAAKKEIENPAGLRDRLCAYLLEVDALTRQLAYLCALYAAPLSLEKSAALLQCTVQDVVSSGARLCAFGIISDSNTSSLSCPHVVAAVIISFIEPDCIVALSKKIVDDLLADHQPSVRVAPLLELAQDSRTPIWWKKAAMDALHIGSLHDAINFVLKALLNKDLIHDGDEKERFVFECQMLHGSIISVLSGPAHPEATVSINRAIEGRPVGDVGTMIVALWAQWMTAQNTGSHIEALRLAQQLMHTARSMQNVVVQGWAAYAVAQHYLWRGQGREAELLLCQAEALLSEGPAINVLPFGLHASAFVPASLGMAYGLQGKYEQAFHMIEKALSEALATNASVAVVLCQLTHARIQYLKGDVERASQEALYVMNRTSAMSELTTWHAIAKGYALLPRVLALKDAGALAEMEAALPIIRAGMPVSADGHLCLLARALTATGDLDRALALLDEAQAIGAAHGSSSLLAEIECLRGDVWDRSGDELRAIALWKQARVIAHAMGAIPYIQWADDRLTREKAKHH